MEATAYARFQRAGTRKVAQVLREIRGKSVLEVQQLLQLTPRACVPVVAKTVQSAAANLTVKAGRQGKSLVPENVYVKACWSTMGPMGQMKRVKPAPQGRAMTFKRKVCHVTVTVSDERAGKAKGNR
jgi:large subunit ribosomal protein L22